VALHNWENAEKGTLLPNGFSSREIEIEGVSEESNLNELPVSPRQENIALCFDQISWREVCLKDNSPEENARVIMLSSREIEMEDALSEQLQSMRRVSLGESNKALCFDPNALGEKPT
jgi:hypothetical protein